MHPEFPVLGSLWRHPWATDDLNLNNNKTTADLPLFSIFVYCRSRKNGSDRPQGISSAQEGQEGSDLHYRLL